MVEQGGGPVEPGALGGQVAADRGDRVLARHDGHEGLGDGVLERGPEEDGAPVGPDMAKGDDPGRLEQRMAGLDGAVLTRSQATGEGPAPALAGVLGGAVASTMQSSASTRALDLASAVPGMGGAPSAVVGGVHDARRSASIASRAWVSVRSRTWRRTRSTLDCWPRLTTAQYGEPDDDVNRDAYWRRSTLATHWPW